MNIKALITTLVLGSSTMASADSVTFSGSVNVSLGSSSGARPTYQPRTPVYQPRTPVVVSRPYVPRPSTPVAVDDCHDAHDHAIHRPVLRPPHVMVPQHWYNPQNTSVSATKSIYRGAITAGAMGTQANLDGYWRGHARWFDLTAPTRIDSGRQEFLLGADKGAYRALTFQGLGAGRTNIQTISIHLIEADGTKRAQVIDVNRALDRNNPTLTIDLDGNFRQIAKIIVWGSTDAGSAYKIQAM